MSWDIVLLKEKMNLEIQNQKLVSIGKRDVLIEKLVKVVPTIDFQNKSWGVLNQKNFSIDFNMGDNKNIDCIMLHVRGNNDSLPVIKLICEKLEIYAYDCSGSMEEPMNFSNIEDIRESFSNWQKYRDQVIKERE